MLRPEPNPIDVAKVRALREERGESQKEVATAVGVSESTVQRWESGETTPRLTEAVRLADALDVPLPDLLR